MKLAPLILCAFLLCGCSSKNEPLDQALELRNIWMQSSGCQFDCVISADYGDKVYSFQMECTGDSEGNLTFTVKDPETLSGIGGLISQEGGSLCFDDKVLAFPLMANEQLTPVSTPWIFLNALKSGYISGCSQEEEGIRIYLDDTFQDAVLRVEVLTDSMHTPIYAEIFWNQRRILSADIRDFVFL